MGKSIFSLLLRETSRIMHQDMSHWIIYNLKSHHLVSRMWDIFLLNLMPTFSSSDRSETRNQFMDSLKVWPSIEKIV